MFGFEMTMLLRNIILVFLDAALFAMFIRAILSWLPLSDDNKFEMFFFYLTEPLIIPSRKLCEKFGWGQNSPIDIGFFITSLALMIVYTIISVV